MMLNNVDFPQPDGPMIETKSPAAVENEMSSTAVITPSAVASRLRMCSTSSRRESGAGSAACNAGGIASSITGSALIASGRKHRGHRRCVSRLQVHIDDGDVTAFDGVDRGRERRGEIVAPFDRSQGQRTLRTPERGKIDFRVVDALPDPIGFHRTAASSCDALLIHFV